MNILVDTSIWIDYFGTGNRSGSLDALIEENRVTINNLILTELIPILTLRNQKKVIRLLRLLPVQSLNIDWDDIITMQTQCLKKGISGIGIPDLLIAQNAVMHKTQLYTLDKHFTKLQSITSLDIYKTTK